MKKIFILLIIHLTLSSIVFGQNIYLKIEGTDSISKKYIHKTPHQNTFKNLKDLKQEVSEIQKQLFNTGYFNAHFLSLKKINDSTYTSKIQINQKFEQITISYPNSIKKTELENLLLPQTLLTEKTFSCSTTNLEHNLNQIIRYFSNSGKTFSSLQLYNIKTTDDIVFADLKINTTKENYITNIIIKGYEKFPKKFIKHYLKIKQNQILNISELERKSNYINNLPFAKELKKPQILFSKDTTTVYLYLQKQKSNTFDGYLGFSSNTETQKLEINGNVNLKLINNLNTGEELYLTYLSTADKQQKINLKLKLPYVFKSPFSIQGELDIFKKDSTFSTNQQSVQLKYPLHQNITIGAGTRFTKSNTLSNTNNTLSNFKKNEYLLNFEHLIIQQNHFFKTKHKTTLELTSSKRKTQIHNTPQQSIYLNSAHILNLNTTNAIYIKNESYYLITENVLDNEMHFIGGINTIRGYQESSIPAYMFTYFNIEYRIQLNHTLYIHSVLDYGINKNKSNFDNLLGFGFGLGLKTKNNLLKLVFANNKTNNEKITFSDSQIHLSLNTTF